MYIFFHQDNMCAKDLGDVEDHLNVRFSCNDQIFFEISKMKIRSISITYSIKKSREEKSLYRTLENDIQNT
jgi:hypothetical protein